MSSKTTETVKLPDEEVKVKLSLCGTCNGVIRCAVSHRMNAKSKREFAKEVMEFNLSVKEVPLLDFRRADLYPWCKCK